MVDYELGAASDIQELPSDTISEDLPTVDGGRDAWLVLSSCFVLGAVVWGILSPFPYKPTAGLDLIDIPGFPYSFGVFQEYYSRQEQLSANESSLAAIGTTASVGP